MWEYTQTVDISALKKEEKPVIIFKHSNRCSISTMALNRLLDAQEELDANATVLLIDVIANRSTSMQLADDLDTEHASPQVIVIKSGEVIHTASHMAIRPATILTHL